MTPIQLPEVPRAAHRFEDPEGYESDILVYTAAQLREYATEAVMADRARVLALASKWRHQEPTCGAMASQNRKDAFRRCANDLLAILTPSEPNSDR